MDNSIIKGARERNRKKIDAEIPGDKLVGTTGVSGWTTSVGRGSHGRNSR